jgi:hypothetical protein
MPGCRVTQMSVESAPGHEHSDMVPQSAFPALETKKVTIEG